MSQSSSFSKAEKTPYNRHFPRSFLLNYGGALQDPREEAVLKRLHDFNCEWLNRPNIALSELAQTVRENIPLLKQYRDTVLVPDFLDEYLAYFEPLKDALSRLDNKDKSTSQPPTREDVIFVLRTLDCEPDLEACIIDELNAAGALFMLSVHLLAPLTLMRNPEDFTEKCRRTQAAQHFKEDPTSRRMRDYILNSITKRRRLVSTGSVWDISDDEEDDNEGSQPSLRRRSRQSTRSRTRRAARSGWAEEEQSHSPSLRRSRAATRSTIRKRRRQNSHSSAERRLTPPDAPRRTSRKRPVEPVYTSTPAKRTKTSTKKTTKSKPGTSFQTTSSSFTESEESKKKTPVQSNTTIQRQAVPTNSRKRPLQPGTTGAPAKTSKPSSKSTVDKPIAITSKDTSKSASCKSGNNSKNRSAMRTCVAYE